MEGLIREQNRVREIIAEYRHPALNGAGEIAARIMEIDIKNAETAMINGDTIAMMTAYTKLKEYES